VLALQCTAGGNADEDEAFACPAVQALVSKLSTSSGEAQQAAGTLAILATEGYNMTSAIKPLVKMLDSGSIIGRFYVMMALVNITGHNHGTIANLVDAGGIPKLREIMRTSTSEMLQVGSLKLLTNLLPVTAGSESIACKVHPFGMALQCSPNTDAIF
jgi:hypothetical protein